MNSVKLTVLRSVLTAALGALVAAGDQVNADALKEAMAAGKTQRPKKDKPEGKATFISVPKEQKDVAKGMGAKWMGPRASWYVPAGVDVAPFVAAGFPVAPLPPRVTKKAAE